MLGESEHEHFWRHRCDESKPSVDCVGIMLVVVPIGRLVTESTYTMRDIDSALLVTDSEVLKRITGRDFYVIPRASVLEKWANSPWHRDTVVHVCWWRLHSTDRVT